MKLQRGVGGDLTANFYTLVMVRQSCVCSLYLFMYICVKVVHPMKYIHIQHFVYGARNPG